MNFSPMTRSSFFVTSAISVGSAAQLARRVEAARSTRERISPPCSPGAPPNVYREIKNAGGCESH